MPEQRIARVISNATDFDNYLKDFWDANKVLALLLDYDGTLAALSNDPNSTFMADEIETMLKKFAKEPTIFVAVISGRGLQDVERKVGIENITYAGNHGLEIQLENGTKHDYKLPEDIQQKYQHLVQELNQELAVNNAVVEDKRVSLTYHYRHTPMNKKYEQRERAIEIIRAHGFRANLAHEAIEAKPPVNWNKGEASRFILETKFGKDWPTKVNVIFAGDDTTDEDAMRVLQGYGRSFRISSDPDIKTYADYRLPQQDLVKELFNCIGRVYIK